jgi:nucleotide-binding universal stress UspA family protein
MTNEASRTVGSDQEPRIVVGVDGSACATRALEYAASEAAQTGAVLLVVCVYGMPPSESTLTFPIGLLEDAAELVMSEAIARVGEVAPEVVVKGELVLGSPRHVLVEMSRTATALVVGTRGHGSLTGMLLGSVSEYAVHHAACTTTVVR